MATFKSKVEKVLIGGTFDSAVYMTHIIIDVDASKLCDVKIAIAYTEKVLHEEVKIGRQYRDYDCTGLPFTSSIDRVHRVLVHNEVGFSLVSTYEHNISFDC